MKLISILILLLTSLSLSANTSVGDFAEQLSKTKSASGLYDTLKSGPLKLGFYQETSNKTSDDPDHLLHGYHNLSIFTFSYKIDQKNKLSYSNEWIFDDTKSTDMDNQYRRGTMTYTRSGILSEKTHGINLDLGFARRQFGKRGLAGSGVYGNNRFQMTASKTVGKWSFADMNEYVISDIKDNNPNGPLAAKVLKDFFHLVPQETYTLNDRISFPWYQELYYQFPKFKAAVENTVSLTHELHFSMNYIVIPEKMNFLLDPYYTLERGFGTRGTHTQDDSSWRLALYSDYNVNSDLNLALKFDFKMLTAHDGKTFAEKWYRRPDMTFYLTWGIF